MLVLEIQLGSSVRATSALHCRAISWPLLPAFYTLGCGLLEKMKPPSRLAPHTDIMVSHLGLQSNTIPSLHISHPTVSFTTVSAVLLHTRRHEPKHQNSLHFLLLQCQAGVLRSRARACHRKEDILGEPWKETEARWSGS